MREFQDKKKFRRFLYSKPALIGLILLVLLFSRAAINAYEKAQESAANVVRVEGQLERLKNRQNVLEKEVGRLATEDGIEREIRNKYSVSKPGEQLLILVDEEEATTTPIVEKESWWEKFKNVFQ